ncbi:tRNA '-O-ribosylphosphate transferase [Aureobasidium pullulans]|uniref:tRNA '-O-ribosylphosphate transferase n=1 Tax=Aureobasidium pullulans TaxID=5580 RepID=A0AB74K6L0_AURPU|nr:tRNA '-O-ribosylphosphate transferase [Aureobasidium pullulans]THX64740.1 tRNA '-O-ribosylphosphate transferase [Aureobasidium pullulans]
MTESNNKDKAGPGIANYPQLSDLIFNNTSNNSFNKVLGELKRSTLSIPNRLRSIKQDANFVSEVASAYGLPLVANERCGSWYIHPEQKKQSAYFKSTDGHMAQWSFSLRRLNLQVLETIGRSDGCIIVDSTRRGKSMPDALSKTIPIWTAVMNRILFPDHPDSHEVTTPPTVVGASEHAQIAARIAGFVESLKTLELGIPSIRQKITKPLRPIWVTPTSSLPESPPNFPSFHPVVLLTASSRISGSESTSETGYVQGAADDAEAWAQGLTAPLFWKHSETLSNTPEDMIEEVIAELVKRGDGNRGSQLTPIGPGKRVAIGTIDAAETDAGAKDIVITVASKENEVLRSKMKTEYLHLTLVDGKVGSRQLRHSLPNLIAWVKAQLSATSASRIVVADTNGKDQGVGIALAILCLFVTDDGNIRSSEEVKDPPNGLNKQTIKQKLSWISVAKPDANPSRTTLQSVNAYLLG